MTGPQQATARGDAPPAVPDGAVLRFAVRGDAWAEGIPPVPRDRDVTVSFSTAQAASEHAEAAALLGYRVVGCAGRERTPAVAHVLVAQSVLEAHPTWWRALAAQADRAYSLASGPAVRMLADVLRAHLTPPA